MQSVTIVLLTLIIVSGLSIFYLIRSRHIERITRIEHGLDEVDPSAFSKTTKSFGVFLVSLALALFTSYGLAYFFSVPDHIFIPGLLLLFGGGSLILISRMDSKR